MLACHQFGRTAQVVDEDVGIDQEIKLWGKYGLEEYLEVKAIAGFNAA